MLDTTINTFITTAACGSFLGASQKLFISAPAVMKQINQLENTIGFKLFNRTNKGLSLTPSGESYLKDCLVLSEQANNAITRAYSLQKSNKYQITLGSSILYPYTNFFPVWSQIQQLHPEINIKIVPFIDIENTDIFHKFYAGTQSYDFISGVFGSTILSQYVDFLQFGRWSFMLTMSSTHPLSKKPFINPSDLYGETILIMRPGNSPENDSIRDSIKKEHPQIKIESVPFDYDINLFNYCADSGKILLSLSGWKDVHPSLTTIPCWIDTTIPYGIIYSKEPTTDMAYMINIIKNEILI